MGRPKGSKNKPKIKKAKEKAKHTRKYAPRVKKSGLTARQIINMSEEDKEKRIRLLLEEQQAIMNLFEIHKRENPFVYYEPSDGTITEDGLALLKKYLKEEDMPAGKLDGQLDVHTSMKPIRGASGGNQCLGGEVEIYDPVDKVYKRVDQIKESFHVLAWNGEKLVPAYAEKPFIKPEDELFTFYLSNGESLVASMNHRVLTASGVYLSILDALVRSQPFLRPSISDTCFSILSQDAFRCLKTTQDLKCGCSVCSRQYDEQLQKDQDTFQDVFPLQAYAHEHMEQVSSHRDGRGSISGHILSYQYVSHRSNQDVRARFVAPFFGSLTNASYRTSAPTLLRHQDFYLSRDVSNRQLQATVESVPKAKHNDILSFPLNSPLLKKYVTVINVSFNRIDVKYDFHVPIYNNYLAGGIINHNSGKSTVGCLECFIDGLGVLPNSLKDIYPKEKLPKEFPRLFRYVTVDHTTLLNTVLPTFRHWVPREYLIDGSWDKSYKEEGKEGQRTLQLGKNGKLLCSIEFMTNEMKVAKFQGPPRHKIVYDEEPREDIYKENLMRFTTAQKLDLLFCWTPTNGLSWATDLFNLDGEYQDNDIDLFKLCSVTNKMANIDVLEKILDNLTDYNELKMRLLGEFISLSGLVYGKLFNPRVHVIEPFPITRDYVVCLGMDPHLVTPTAAVFLAIDRENNYYVTDCYFKDADTAEVKKDIHRVFTDNGYRWGWSVVDKSSNSDIQAFGGRNIFKELSSPPFPIKALRQSIKHEGSIKAGVDEIKKCLKEREVIGSDGVPRIFPPRLFIFNRPSNKPLIHAFKTLERDTYVNEERNGQKDRIKEGKFHLHAALRYLFQYPLNYFPEIIDIPQPQFFDQAACW